ncbi:MAG: hypothetical protein A2928_04590 [Candidatus Taylorbacteria bacterium RIFCSPLOWO2_01_FULL_45_15b]|uniref:Uncharacterized protein n=1 Tax=Candidatus Taylorbacteria bacterium RIFCSPLOWO2_01_FULL_45_15b TaxID=1802319 RepID=A0A1G2NDE2_9BACT|nr:MAG: hypothetical protein A2928_04590 [Candidatus Taylorbacteria bacterium RIFCSPLOWO2_01_FULL_45_15b]
MKVTRVERTWMYFVFGLTAVLGASLIVYLSFANIKEPSDLHDLTFVGLLFLIFGGYMIFVIKNDQL